ncbi:MAG: type VI secretion system protein TssA [Phycisphaerales bacterium]|nr:type VI secretion system protein TssA [Phycisphaerales bacterium]
MDIDRFLQEVSPDAPCGEDLSYDPAFLEFERLSAGKEETQFSEAEEANWREVKKAAVELLERTRDLRIVMQFAVAALETEGLPGFRSAIALLRGLIERRWDHVHPQLDPDDGHDPLWRMNLVSSLCPPPESRFGDKLRFEERLRAVPLSNSKQIGRFSRRQMLIAAGEATAKEGEETPDQALIDASFEDTPTEELQTTSKAIGETIDDIRAMDQFITQTVGAGRAPSLDGIVTVLGDLRGALAKVLARRGYGDPAGGETGGADGAPDAGAPAGGGGGAAFAVSGEIRSPQEVLLALDKICRYYEQAEMSSPVPLLLKGAQRLVSKNYLEISRVLTPDAIQMITQISGVDLNSE